MSKLKETLKDLEDAILAWDCTDSEPAQQSELIEPNKRARELLEDLKMQLLELSEN